MQSVRYMVSCRSFPAWRRGAHTARRALVFCFWRATCAPRLARRKVGTAVPSRPRSSHHVEGQRASVMECGAARRFEAESTNQLCRPFRARFSYRSSNPGLTPRATICRPSGLPAWPSARKGRLSPAVFNFLVTLRINATASWSAAVPAAFESDPKRCGAPHSKTLLRYILSAWPSGIGLVSSPN